MTNTVSRKLPLWALRLDRTANSLQHVQYPASPEDGLRQALALAELGWRQIFTSLRQPYPTACERELSDRAYQMVTDWQRIRDRLTFRRS